jgi:hypothetical protein
MRQNKTLSTSFEGIFKGFFHLIIKFTVTAKDIRGYFRNAGISVTKEDRDINYNKL